MSESLDMSYLATVSENQCPLCGQANACRRAGGADPSPERCWCEEVTIPPKVLLSIPLHLQQKACLCPACAGCRPSACGPLPETEEPDTYFTEDGLTVFTRAYHLRRGYCCENGCRHCPYGEKNLTAISGLKPSP